MIFVGFPIFLKLVSVTFFLLIFYLCISTINSRIIIEKDFIIINSGLLINKKIAVSDILKVYEASSDIYIPKIIPSAVYSKNIVAIEYGHENILYVSVKEKEEFINYINQLVSNRNEACTSKSDRV